ncbi:MULTISPECIES: PHP domain-containing protein [unclassified Ornithinimicrobium]|uniref:PHP domain-containing protein n=1 Tax=unclassified Ornithinimicrobium TaxID=2615080 RepID=UPI00385399DF
MAATPTRAVVDLHTHSVCSDGTETPAEVVRAASTAGVDVVALTDHDVVTGWAEADAAGREHSVLVVPGIEVSCSWQGISVHLLAYLPDPEDRPLAAALAASRGSRDSRLRVMVERLASDGFPVDVDEVLAAAGHGVPLGRPHVADALVRAGVFAHRDEAFADLLAPSSPYYVAHAAPDPVRATELVVAAGGVAVIAHPFASSRGRVVPDRVVVEMVDAGMAGLEVDHRDHGPAEREHAAQLVRRLGLLRTGSSDYHGTGKLNRLGEHTTAPDVLDQILARGTGAAVLGAAG